MESINSEIPKKEKDFEKFKAEGINFKKTFWSEFIEKYNLDDIEGYEQRSYEETETLKDQSLNINREIKNIDYKI